MRIAAEAAVAAAKLAPITHAVANSRRMHRIVPEGRFVPYSREMSDQRTVRVTTCRDSAEVAVIRSVLEAHGIRPIIPGEVVSAMGPHLTAFSIPVFVLEDDVAEAEKLIAEIRASTPVGEGDDDELEDAADDDENTLARPEADVAVRVDRRVHMGVTVILALVLTFGTGHMSTAAWKRGIALAALEIIGIRHMVAGNRWGVAIVAAAVLVDLVGSVLRVRARGAPAKLPTATLQRR